MKHFVGQQTGLEEYSKRNWQTMKGKSSGTQTASKRILCSDKFNLLNNS